MLSALRSLSWILRDHTILLTVAATQREKITVSRTQSLEWSPSLATVRFRSRHITSSILAFFPHGWNIDNEQMNSHTLCALWIVTKGITVIILNLISPNNSNLFIGRNNWKDISGSRIAEAPGWWCTLSRFWKPVKIKQYCASRQMPCSFQEGCDLP